MSEVVEVFEVLKKGKLYGNGNGKGSKAMFERDGWMGGLGRGQNRSQRGVLGGLKLSAGMRQGLFCD